MPLNGLQSLAKEKKHTVKYVSIIINKTKQLAFMLI